MKYATIIAVALLLVGCHGPHGQSNLRWRESGPNTWPIQNAKVELESGARAIDDPPSGIEFNVTSHRRYATRVEVRFAGQEHPCGFAVVFDADGLASDLATKRKEFKDAGMLDALDEYIVMLNTPKPTGYYE